MYGVPQAGLTVPAVAGQLERGVRRHSARDVRVFRPGHMEATQVLDLRSQVPGH